MTPEADRIHARLLRLDWTGHEHERVANDIEAAKLIRAQAEEIEMGSIEAHIATIAVDEIGKQIVAEWTEWEPTCELRLVRIPRTTTYPDRLQQRFVRLGLGTAGHVATKEYRWQDVPIMVGA